MSTGTRIETVPERLAKYSITEPNSGCTLWMGRLKAGGYGQISVGPVHRAVHRVAYELEVGLIPEGLTLDHLCRNRSCVNPSHMEPVTLAVNIRRSNNAAGQNARKTHCLYGHSLTDAPLKVAKTKLERVCKLCRQRRARESYHRKRADDLAARSGR